MTSPYLVPSFQEVGTHRGFTSGQQPVLPLLNLSQSLSQ